MAVGVACLLSASSPWAAAAFSALLALLAVAFVGILCHRGPGQAYWVGVAVCGRLYLTLSLGPWFDAAVRPSLITTGPSRSPTRSSCPKGVVGSFRPLR